MDNTRKNEYLAALERLSASGPLDDAGDLPSVGSDQDLKRWIKENRVFAVRGCGVGKFAFLTRSWQELVIEQEIAAIESDIDVPDTIVAVAEKICRILEERREIWDRQDEEREALIQAKELRLAKARERQQARLAAGDLKISTTVADLSGLTGLSLSAAVPAASDGTGRSATTATTPAVTTSPSLDDREASESIAKELMGEPERGEKVKVVGEVRVRNCVLP
jgi:hypothetical protein